MSELYDRYRQRILETIGGLPRASGVAVMLAACERMYAVLAQIDMQGACETLRLRKILDSMWDGRVLDTEFITVPEDIVVDSLSVELGMMAADSIQMARAVVVQGVGTIDEVLLIAVDMANAIDAAQEDPLEVGLGLIDSFLVIPDSCVSVEVARQFSDISDQYEGEGDVMARQRLRDRSSAQDLTCGMPF
ncbi:hypothetical protein [Stenotrophomonas sp. PS02289]|uniref:hypothetical protein n=1 Tax=Stenotrophomonas sp. PS02289 TaxID=2991422 RepID=UPI00249B28AA|nr:hypothetical protein [Stenotrophomonas sp. PS02289]